MNTAHVFQHKFTGVQIFVYHRATKEIAKTEFVHLVLNPDDWIYIGVKTADLIIPA